MSGPNAIDTTEWEQLAGRKSARAAAGILALVVFGIGGFLAADGKTASLVFGAPFILFGVFALWKAFAPAKSHPFVKVLAQRPNAVAKIILRDIYYGTDVTAPQYSYTELAVELNDGERVHVTVPREHGAAWQTKLHAVLPHAEVVHP